MCRILVTLILKIVSFCSQWEERTWETCCHRFICCSTSLPKRAGITLIFSFSVSCFPYEHPQLWTSFTHKKYAFQTTQEKPSPFFQSICLKKGGCINFKAEKCLIEHSGLTPKSDCWLKIDFNVMHLANLCKKNWQKLQIHGSRYLQNSVLYPASILALQLQGILIWTFCIFFLQ